eukprot:35438-Amphidinium_carterae.1
MFTPGFSLPDASEGQERASKFVGGVSCSDILLEACRVARCDCLRSSRCEAEPRPHAAEFKDCHVRSQWSPLKKSGAPKAHEHK